MKRPERGRNEKEAFYYFDVRLAGQRIVSTSLVLWALVLSQIGVQIGVLSQIGPMLSSYAYA